MKYAKFIIFICVCFSSGCNPIRSQMPIALNPAATSQLRIKSVSHWQDVASDVADRISSAVKYRNDLKIVPIYIEKSDGLTQFGKVFDAFLQSEIVSRGLQVSSIKEYDNINLKYEVLSIDHSMNIGRPPIGTFTASSGIAIVAKSLKTISEWKAAAIGAGVGLDLLTNSLASRSDTEVVVSVAIEHNNRFVAHVANSYYIDDYDKFLYEKKNEINNFGISVR